MGFRFRKCCVCTRGRLKSTELSIENAESLCGIGVSGPRIQIVGHLSPLRCTVALSIRVDDFDDGVSALAAHISETKTRRVEIDTFAPILVSLAASGHGLRKQVFAEAGCALGEMLTKCLSNENDKTGAFGASRTAVCAVEEMFNAWREVPDFANSFPGAMDLFLTNGGQIFILKSAIETPVMLTQTG